MGTIVFQEESKEEASDLDSVLFSVSNLEPVYKVQKEEFKGNNCFKNIFRSNRKTVDHHGIVICGHRGGFKAT